MLVGSCNVRSSLQVFAVLHRDDYVGSVDEVGKEDALWLK